MFMAILCWNTALPDSTTDKLRSDGVAHRELTLEAIHDTLQTANNRVELSHQPTRVRERGLRRFKSRLQAQQFPDVHAAVDNLFNLGRHLICVYHYRKLEAQRLCVLGKGSGRMRQCSRRNSLREEELTCQYP